MTKAELTVAIEQELTSLTRVSEVVAQLLEAAGQDLRPWHAAAGAKYVADLFMGLENLCGRRYAALGRERPKGPDSHRRVLEEFLATDDLGASLTPELTDRLRKYLRFRHRFTRGYGYEVAWELVEEPLRLLPETVQVLGQHWRDWLQALPDSDVR